MKSKFLALIIPPFVAIGVGAVLLWNPALFLEKKIVKTIEDQCSVALTDCRLTLSDITSFPWDDVYVFESLYDKTSVEKILGSKNSENHWRGHLIFLKERRVIGHTKFLRGDDGVILNRIVIDVSGGYEQFTPKTATFIVENGSRPDSYRLIPVLP